MKFTWIAALAAVAALVASAASAAPQPLRLHKIVATRQNDSFRLRIEMDRAWKSGALRPGSGNSLIVFYETSGDNRADYVGRISYRDGRLWDTIKGVGGPLPQVPVSRPNGRDARFQHPSDVLFPDP